LSGDNCNQDLVFEKLKTKPVLVYPLLRKEEKWEEANLIFLTIAIKTQ